MIAGDDAPRSEHEKDMRSRLLNAAEELYAEHGPEGVTIRAVARRAECPTQMVYNLFGDHLTLVSTMYHRVVEEVNVILDDSDVFGPSDLSARNDVWFAVADQYRAYCKAYPGRFRLIRTAGLEINVEGAGELQNKLVDRVVELSTVAQSPEPELLEARLRLSLSCIHGFIQGELEGFIPDEHAEALFGELLTRFAAPFHELMIN